MLKTKTNTKNNTSNTKKLTAFLVKLEHVQTDVRVDGRYSF